MFKKILTGFLVSFCFVVHAQFWTENSSGFTNNLTGLNRFHVVDENVAWAIAYDGVNTINNVQQFSKTDDSGNTWSAGSFDLGDTGLGISDVSGVDGTTAFVAAHPRQAGQQGGIWKTIDAGMTWTQQTGAAFNSATSFPNVVHYFDANNGLAIGDPANGYWEIYSSNDGGATYTRIPSSSLPSPLSNETGFLAQFAYSGNSIWFTTSAGRIVHSADRGVSWSVYQSPLSNFGGTAISGDISFATATRGVIQDNSGNLYRSTDAGANWTTIVLSGTGAPYGGAITYIPNTTSMVSTGGEVSFAGSSYSRDDGVTWINIDTDQHVDNVFFNTTVGYSGSFSNATTGQGVFKYVGNVLSENSIEDRFDLILVHNTVQEHLEITTDQNILSTDIYDLHGRLITTSTSAIINTNQLKSGIYLAQITTDLGKRTSKFIKQ
ncbi:T9SS type A sorting domain-containing protein [Nonlabens sp. Asnod2-A12]|uniref:T9SS type A sorting domain-containing protein n=1 Tax=Nonlabens sp. Asnod2-A12 TaxID=3160578 RepID=UPI00386E5C13